MLNRPDSCETALCGAMVHTQEERPEFTIAERLKLLREAENEGNQAAFAAKLEISPSRWNNFEKGLPLSKDVAFRLVRKVPGLTLDWLYLAIEDGLTLALRRRLHAAQRRKGSKRAS